MKYILKQSMHLGCIKESFKAGTVIEKKDDGSLLIDGRTFATNRDLDILIKHDFVLPYSKESEEQCTLAEKSIQTFEQEKIDKHNKKMPVIQSDEDDLGDIDISHTKIKKKEPINKNAKLEVIVGDESVEENAARIRRASKPDEIAKRAEEKASSIPKMPIVEDDGSLAGESRGPSRNAGEVKSPKDTEKFQKERTKVIVTAKAQEQIETVEELVEEVVKEAVSEKKENTLPPDESDIENFNSDDAANVKETPIVKQEPVKTVTATPKVAAEIKTSEQTTATSSLQPQTEVKEKKKGGRPKGSKNKPKITPNVPEKQE